MATLQYVCDITQDDVDAALACVSRHALAEEADLGEHRNRS
ncbi:hypothetical protein ACIRP2_36845 [Streptomyces sp. NPDC101194]